MTVINLAFYGLVFAALFLVVGVLVQNRETKTTMMSLAGVAGGLSLLAVLFTFLKF
jgi:NADH:ubiquinone oxidoreductase subunit 4 (subunit M)